MLKRKARANSRMLVKRFFLRERTRHSRKSSRSFNRLMIDAKTARMEKSGRFFLGAAGSSGGMGDPLPQGERAFMTLNHIVF